MEPPWFMTLQNKTGYSFDNLGEPIKNSSGTPATPLHFGGGHVNPNAAAHPGLVYDADEQDYIGYLCDDATNYTASIEAPDSVSVSVHPSVLRFKHKGETKAFQVIFRVEGDSNIDNDVFGKLIWSNGEYTVASLIAVHPSRSDILME
ncbi:subtilisin-like protease SBT5.3 [Selaginella moellendorffii]|uniref:subtilisin-like protease SBT5.3 n=1 Tax=Selaginella moellendorffii TaxID=88036 RepID=UPI000D1D0001|nr:subtilisin-like protease SBT5.3 [Selaginella moellendorffii]|eukprot:XP_024518477.1 subtilisin-like protease SBT5.3 [Selaginella moellendorffii]